MNRIVLRSIAILTSVLIAGASLTAPAQAPVNQKVNQKLQQSRKSPVFEYDKSEIPGPKPWTHEDFHNKSENFRFAILGDRGGGASPLETYERSIDQLNWLQPEFVMSVGDYVEGYTDDPKEMDAQWDEAEEIINKLEMPFFYVHGNHDINMPLTRKAWAERRGPQYYHFKYKDVLADASESGRDARKADGESQGSQCRARWWQG